LEDDIKDALQETYLQVYKNLYQLKNIDKFNSWITSILINTCNLILRKKGIFNLSYEEINADNFIETDDDFIEVDSNIDFFEILESLDCGDKTLLTMYYSNEYTSKEMSEVLNINESTIRSRINRAKQKIKQNFNREDKYESYN